MAKKCDVFISFKAEEINEAIWVRTTLESHGISCWMAPESIPGGSSYVNEIAKAIKRAKVFVLLVSDKAQNSLWISKELDAALNEGKLIMPYMIEECEIKDSFGFYLSGIQMYQAYKNKKENIDKMIREIKAVTEDNGSSIFSDEFKQSVSSFTKKIFNIDLSFLIRLTPYAKLTYPNQYLPFNIITVIAILLFIYVFGGLSYSTGEILFSFLFSFALFIIMWNLGKPFARMIGKLKNKYMIYILSIISGIFLFFATLALGAYFAFIMSNF